jgi:hypothetical protein
MEQIVYCRARDESRSIPLCLAQDGGEPAKGVWCHSRRLRLADAERRNDPEDVDLFFRRTIDGFMLSGDEHAGFGGSEQRVNDDKGYAHFDSVKRGDLARFSFVAHDFLDDQGWSAGHWGDETSVMGVVPGAATAEASEEILPRPLVVHPGNMEFFFAGDGVTWVAITPDKPGGPADNRKPRRLPLDVHAEAAQVPTWVTALVAPGDASHDIMLLNPAYSHSVWMTPGSEARFLHVCFNDPREIRPVKLGGNMRRGTETESSEGAARRASR